MDEVERLAELLKETSDHHDPFEKTHPPHNWYDWYAPYLYARLKGADPETATKAADARMEEIFRHAAST